MSNLVYLSGPTGKIPEGNLPFSADWKTYAASAFLKSGINVANPIELDISGFISDVPNLGNSIKYSLSLIDKSNLMLANLFQPHESTTMELFYAHRQGKRVVVIGNEPFNPWVTFHSEARFQKVKDALDYFMNTPKEDDKIAWSSQFEGELIKKSEKYPPEGEMDFDYFGGNIPVLVLAPHSTAYFKNGDLFSPELYTGSLSVLLHKITGCHSLIGSYCMVHDPMIYLNSSPYINFLSQLVKRINIKFVVILRGLEWTSSSDLIINSWNKSSLINKGEYLNLLTSILKLKDFKEISFDSNNHFSTRTLGNILFEEFSIPTIDIEIHKRFRTPNLHPGLYSNLYTALAQFLMLVGMS